MFGLTEAESTAKGKLGVGMDWKEEIKDSDPWIREQKQAAKKKAKEEQEKEEKEARRARLLAQEGGSGAMSEPAEPGSPGNTLPY